MGAGDCYPAAFKAINSSKFNDDWIVGESLSVIS